jgi:hypothetical protein
MNRVLGATLLIFIAAGWAAAQTGQFPTVPPPIPSPGSVPNANASPLPQIAPGPAAPTPRGHSSTIVQVPGQPIVVIPNGSRKGDSFSKRIERCIHYGSAAGVQPNDMGSFAAQCANQ